MINLMKKNKDGINVSFDFNVEGYGKDIVVEFSQTNRGGENKWHNASVVTDMIIKRMVMSGDCGKDIQQLKSYIAENFSEDLHVVDELEKSAKKVDNVSISLPTTIYAHSRGMKTESRGMKDTFLPLIVVINDNDVSMDFWDFDLFGYKAVSTAYDALINGNIPESRNHFVDFSKIKEIHDGLVQDSKEMID